MATKWNEIQDSDTYKALNPQEQVALQRRYFDNVIFKSDTFKNLSPTEQSTLKTKFFSQGVVGQQQQQNATDIELVNQLRGSVPLTQQQRGGLPISKEVLLTEPQRQAAYDKLLQQGKTPEQIQFILDVNKRVEVPPTLGRSIGAAGGALALPLALNLIPGFAALPEEAVTIPLALAKFGKTAAPLIGAGLGGGIGETTQIALEEKRLISKGEFLKAFGKEVAFEGVSRGFVLGGKLAFSPFIKRTIPEAANIIEGFREVGGVLPPSAIDKRFTLSIADEVVRGSFGSKEIFQELAERTATATDVYTDVLLDRMASGVSRIGTTQLGEEFGKGITRPEGFVFRMLDDLFTPLYKEIDDLTKAATASTGKLKVFARPLLEQDKRLKGLILDPPGRDKLNRIMSLPDKISLGDLRDLRTSFLGDTRRLARDADKNSGILKRVSKVTNDILTDPSTTQGLTPEARRLLENTNRLYAVSREGLEKTFTERLAKKLTRNPTSVIKELFPQRNPEAVKALRLSLVEPISGRPSKEGDVLWKQLRTAWFADLAEQTTAGDVVNPRIFERGLRKMGTETIAEMIPDAEGQRQVRNMKDLFKAMSKKPAGGASLFIRGGQVGGAFMMYNGAKEGDWLQATAGGALVFGPRLFAKLAAHPLGNRLVTSGIKLKPGSTSLVPITARIINLARQIDREEIAKVIREKERGRALTRQAVRRRR